MGTGKSIKYYYPTLLLGGLIIMLVFALTLSPDMADLFRTGRTYTRTGTGYPVMDWMGGLDNRLLFYSLSALIWFAFVVLLKYSGDWFFGHPIPIIGGAILLCQPSIMYYLTSRGSFELLLHLLWGMGMMAVLFDYKARLAKGLYLLTVFAMVWTFGPGPALLPVISLIVMRLLHGRGNNISLSFIGWAIAIWMFSTAGLSVYQGQSFSTYAYQVFNATVEGTWFNTADGSLILYPVIFYAFYLYRIPELVNRAVGQRDSRLYALLIWIATAAICSVFLGFSAVVLPMVILGAIAVFSDWKSGLSSRRMRPWALLHLLSLMGYVLLIYLWLAPMGTIKALLPGIVTGIVLLSGIISFLVWYEMGKRRTAFYILSALHYLFVLGYIMFFLPAMLKL